MTLHWIGATKDENEEDLICDPHHKDSIIAVLPDVTEINCKGCSMGQSRDIYGVCHFCPVGTHQPQDFRRNNEVGAVKVDGQIGANNVKWLLSKNWSNEEIITDPEEVVCETCPAGTFSDKILELSDFDRIPEDFPIITCTAVSGQASYADCREATLEFWGVNFGRVSLSGIPAGLMIGFAGHF